MVSTTASKARAFSYLASGLLAVLLAGCAADGGAPPALSGGQTCKSIFAELTRLDKEGVENIIQRQTAGQKLPPAQKAKADLYNKLLNEYLGARCHENKST
jgi:hypothetical protein